MKTLYRLLFSGLVIFVTTFTSSFAKEKPLTYEDHQRWDAIAQSDLELINGDSLPLRKLGTSKQRLYLWIGQAIPPNDGDALLLKELKKSGQIWFLDTPEALFVTGDRTLMRNMNGDFVPALVDTAVAQFEEVIIVTSDVGAVPTLRGLRQWQQQTQDKAKLNRLKNVVLFFPSLYVNTPAAGEDRELFPIAFHTALPITLIQPEKGAQTNFIHETINALRSGGSLVKRFDMKNALDDHYRYVDIRKMSKRSAQTIAQSVDEFLAYSQSLNYQIYSSFEIPQLAKKPKSEMVRGLIKLDPPIKWPDNILLTDMNGRKNNVKRDYQGKALLINFWATWCPHCVEEIPSMNNALKQLDQNKFAMVSVSYRDSQKTLDEFVKCLLKEVQVDFPILMDIDGEVSAQWKVFAFPSSFIVDKDGWIHYSINAGSIWDTPEMIRIMREVSEK